MTNEDYEILPHKLLSDLKFEVEALKKKLTRPDAKANELILEIESMKDSVHELNVVFEKAMDEMKDEDASKTLKQIKEKLSTVVTQNETIARGMIAISDKLEEFMKRNTSKPATPTPVYSQQTQSIQHTMGPPSPGPSRVAPTPMPVAPSMSSNDNFPPPPKMPVGKKRKLGLFK